MSSDYLSDAFRKRLLCGAATSCWLLNERHMILRQRSVDDIEEDRFEARQRVLKAYEDVDVHAELQTALKELLGPFASRSSVARTEEAQSTFDPIIDALPISGAHKAALMRMHVEAVSAGLSSAEYVSEGLRALLTSCSGANVRSLSLEEHPLSMTRYVQLKATALVRNGEEIQTSFDRDRAGTREILESAKKLFQSLQASLYAWLVNVPSSLEGYGVAGDDV